MNRKRRKTFLVSGIVVAIAILGILALTSSRRAAERRVPPGGVLVAQHDQTSIYYVDKEGPETGKRLKDWAKHWGGRGPGPYPGYGGNLAAIGIDTQGIVRLNGKAYDVPKGKFRVVVTELPFTVGRVIDRIRTLMQ